MARERPVIAVCGKGGVGKTAITALVARALLEEGALAPLLLVDADPMMGLASSIGIRPAATLGQVRDRLVHTVRGGEAGKREVSASLDYWLLEALYEGDDHALLVMGRSTSAGCFCPVNTLLKQAIDLVSSPFGAVLIDAEAGIEQVHREVTRAVTQALVVLDGSTRALETLEVLCELLPRSTTVSAVANRSRDGESAQPLPEGVTLAATIPEDDQLRTHDRAGRSLWSLPTDSPAVAASRGLVDALLGRAK